MRRSSKQSSDIYDTLVYHSMLEIVTIYRQWMFIKYNSNTAVTKHKVQLSNPYDDIANV